MKTVLLFTLITMFYSSTGAQEVVENVFLKREYWKANPDISTIKKDIQQGHDISALDGHKFDAVTWAILEKNSKEIISFLLDQRGNEPNKITHDRRTYVFWAAYKGEYALMLDLIERGARMDLKDQFGYSVMTFSAVTGQTDQQIYDLCIAHGAKITSETNDNGADVLLMVSPYLENEKQLNYFISKGLNMQTKDKEGNNVFVYAASQGNEFMMSKALEAGLKANVNNGKAAYYAAKGTRSNKNDSKTFAFLKQHGVTFQYVDEEGNNLLHILVSKKNYKDGIEYLVNEGVDVNAQNSDGKTPLLIAIENTSSENIRALTALGANYNISDADGNTAIHAAVKNGNDNVLDLVLSEYNQVINEPNKNGLTPLHVAAMTAYNFASLEILIANGADLSIKTTFDETVFDLAKENEQLNLTDEQLNALKNEN